MATNQKSIIGVLIGIIAIMALALVWLFVDRNNTKSQLEGELTEMQQAKTELDQKYNEAIANLEALQGENAELDQLIEDQKAELQNQRNRIAGLIRSKKDLDEARDEIAKLTEQANQYLAELEQLRDQNEFLARENTELSVQRDSLTSDLETQMEQKAELIAEKTQLKTINQELSQNNELLDAKVTKASVLEVADIDAEPIMLDNGKEKKRNKADKVSRLDVCFNVSPNEIAEEGIETFHLRVILPSGETMSIDSKGSGLFTNRSNGEQMRYTMAGNFEYTQDPKNLCMQWNPGVPFPAGDYTVELYNKGYLSGKTNVKLR